MSKHIKGPWEVAKRRGSWDWVVFVPNTPNEICQMFHDGTEFNEIGEANARLIAAAPDLLEACKGALELLASDFDSGRTTVEVVAILQAAIAKAEGKP